MTVIAQGPVGIYAKVLKDSITTAGIRLITYEVSYPRLILAELNTHRGLSKNSASSRAIPFNKMKEQLTGRPVRFGQGNNGMQDKGEDFEGEVTCFDQDVLVTVDPGTAWRLAQASALHYSEAFFNAGYAKQVYNRLTEPFQMMKSVITATEMANFFWLRDDGAADPTLAALARCMRDAARLSVPVVRMDGEWHLPYVESRVHSDDLVMEYFITDDEGNATVLNLEQAIQVSAARCAAVSFRNTDYDLKKSQEVHARLVGDERKHSSAMEHQCTPIEEMFHDEDTGVVLNVPEWPGSWQHGVSHMDRKGRLWSGNLCGWVQYRKTIAGENVEGFGL